MGRFVVVRGAQPYRRRLQRVGRTGEEARKDRDMRKMIIIGCMIAVSTVHGGVISSGDSAPMTLDLRTGARESTGDEALTYSSLWDGGEGATVTIAQDGAALVEGLTGEGERAWSVTRKGTYVLTHTTYTNGVAGKVEAATFVVTGKDVPFATGDVTVTSYSNKYDGAAHGIGLTVADGIAGAVVKYATAVDGEFTAIEPTLTDVGSMTVWCEIAAPGYITQTNSATVTITKRAVTLTSGDASKNYDGSPVLCGDIHVTGDGFISGEGATFTMTGSQTSVGTSENTFTYTLNEGTKADNYDITTVNGTLAVTKATVGPGGGGTGGGDEPGGGEVPQGGESKFDITAMYDGEGHTIDTNALTAAFGAAMIGEFAVEYAKDDGSGNGGRGAPALPWGAVPAYTNAGEYVVWYRVTNPNYEDFVHAAKVTIAKREVTVTSADGSWTYDGQAHSNATVMCEGFVSGEGIVANNFATITDVGSVANAFTYAFADGTLAGNYLVTCVTGTLTISEAYKAFVIRCEWIEDAIRPATMDFMVQTNGVDWQIENVTAVDEWKRVTDVKVYDQGVSIDYGLVALPAEGIRSEIEKLGCRTVGSLSGLDNVLTESGWSNVGSSTINTVVGTVDGWRRFGELRMSDLVIAEDTSKGVFFKVCNFKSTFDIDDGTDGIGGEASRFSYSGVYDGVGHGIGVEVANAPSGMTVKYARGNAGTPPSDGWSAVNPLFTNVCDRAVVWYAVECAGYVAYTNSATVTISPKGVTVRADAKSRPYGQPDVPLTYTAEGLVAGDALGGALSRDPGEAAGTYSIRQGTLANANYAINYIGADYVIAKVSINPTDVFGGNGSEESPLVCEKVYDGSAQSVEIKPHFNEEYRFLWSLTKGDESSYSETAPTLRNVADGELTVYFKFVTGNYEPYYGKVIFRILPKTLTDEMVVLTDEAFFFDPESGQKTPSVTVADTNSFGTVISTAADYDVAYGDSTSSAGAVPVTVTGKNNYAGTVTKTFDVLKRPVPSPVIGAKAYNGRNQTATITVDDRWMVVENGGGINAGEYPVILRLVNSDDYMWKGSDGKSSDWTGVFRITRGANGWSRAPGIANWTEGETPSEPSMGTPRRGTTSYVTYRKRGADVSTAVREKPSRAGKYTARFVVEETENYVGTFRDVDFEILPGVGGFTETQTTPVPVPYVWLEKYLVKYGKGDYETAGHAKGENDVSLWESYVAGLDPEDAKSKFMAKIGMGVDGKAVVTWTPDLSKDEKPRKYTTLGKEKLGDDTWLPVTDANKAKMRFFKVTVEMK